VFWAVRNDDHAKALAAFGRIGAVSVSEPYAHFIVLHSKQALPPRQLVELALRLRLAWLQAVPFNQRATLLTTADRIALHDPAGCKPVGVLGDPDIVPNYPLPAQP